MANPHIRESSEIRSLLHNFGIRARDNISNLEFEGKLGFLIQKHADEDKPLDLPQVSSLCVLPKYATSFPKIHFVSDFTRENRYETLKKSLLSQRHKYIITETYIIDKFYSNGARVSYDEEGRIIQCIEKISDRYGVNSLDLFCPAPTHLRETFTPVALRLSIKEEREIDPSFIRGNVTVVSIRKKLRTSIVIGIFSIDLTEVETTAPGTDVVETSCEVEVELLNEYSKNLREYVQIGSGPENVSVQIVGSLVNTLRYLEEISRKS